MIGIIVLKQTHITKTNNTYTIGILQTASHTSLDEAKQGFIDTVTSRLDNTVTFITRNAEGSIINAHTIAQHFHATDSINAIYAIGTPALQAIASIEKKKPIIIAAVSNPQELGIITNKTNICGTTDMIDIPDAVNAIKSILPHVKTIALLYTIAEENSIAQIKIIEKELGKQNLLFIRVGISTEMDIPPAIANIASKVDAIMTPTDNLIASAMPMISTIAHNAKLPLIASHNTAVKQGALMSRGVNYYICGQESGKITLSVLCDGKKPYKLPIDAIKYNTIMINEKIFNELNLTLPTTSDTIIFINDK